MHLGVDQVVRNWMQVRDLVDYFDFEPVSGGELKRVLGRGRVRDGFGAVETPQKWPKEEGG